MSSDSSDSSQQTDSGEEGEEDDLSHLGAAQTEIKSFTVKRESLERTEEGCKKRKLASTPLGAFPASSLEVLPASGLPESDVIRDIVPGSNNKIVSQHNFIQVQQQFGDVTVTGTRNLTIGGTQNIGKQGPSPRRKKRPTLVKKLMKRTISKITPWTDGMVKTSSLMKVMKKINNGATWITIKGSPGEGKTTTAYMALEKLHRSGRQVFQVVSPVEFSEVTASASRPVIMVDDIFGNLEFDQAEWMRWKPVLHQVLGGKEHRSHESKKKRLEDRRVTVILIGRDYVLNSASCDMGRMSDVFTRDAFVVNMSNKVEREMKEKVAIWKAISESSGIVLDKKTIDTICQINVPHGFPHVCRLFVTLRQEDASIDAKRFFKTPLEFLNQTVQKFLKDKAKLFLFKEMIKGDGKVGIHELGNSDSSFDAIAVGEDLLGTYLRKEEGHFIFDHPSIYDSVAFNLCKHIPLFVIENCNLSFLHERIRLESSDERKNDLSCGSSLVVHIPRTFIVDLAKRFAFELSNKNFLHVLSHKALANEELVEEMMTRVTIPMTELLNLTDMNTGFIFLSMVASNRSPQLLKYLDKQRKTQLTPGEISIVLYGVFKFAASDVLKYLTETREKLSLDYAYDDLKQSPLMIAAGTRDSQFVHQILKLSSDFDERDFWNATVLHYLCENGLVDALEEVIGRGADMDVVDWYGRSPLWLACRNSQVEVARLLLERRAKIDEKTVVKACGVGDMEVVALLFEEGATVDMSTHITPLASACRRGHVKVMKFLIDKGASVNTSGASSWTPLHEACFYNKPQSVLCLLENGADIDISDKTGDTPIQRAAGKGSKDCVYELLKHGADVNVQNADGNTSLYSAAGRGSKECVDELLKHGAEVNVQNADGNTPLHTAAVRGYKDCVDSLLKAGADVNVQNADGNTPLYIAAGSKSRNTKESRECIDMLLKAGAMMVP